MNVSDRLLSICELINNSKIYDVGCDHALLDIYLTMYKKCKCICIDVDQKIIKRAQNNIQKYNLTDKIETRIGNGFENLNIEKDSIMILSGMGTNTILKIVDNNKPDTIICQTNTEQYILRKGMNEKGYYINRENIVKDNNRFYITIEFKKGNEKYSNKEYFLGPKLLKDNNNTFKDYVKSLYEKNLKAYKKSIEYNIESDVIELMKAIKDYNEL